MWLIHVNGARLSNAIMLEHAHDCASTMAKTPLKKAETFRLYQLIIKRIPSNCMVFRRRKNLSAANSNDPGQSELNNG
jgi:hypothetical protein